MVVSVSVVVLLLVLTVVFLRSGGLKVSHAVVCALLGFFLAGTSMAPTIQDGVASTAEIVSSLRP
ncbi:hypothetical protein ACFFSH_12965 [Streptomyces filamentosus]|uniref:Uncharacterized protein n=1 Tax=Streptomyces filamentosus TaxID=67294 RepID=A0A919BXE8_STRFL|nr:hypothetical protein [Streptomyces filamentosus]GHG27123.1 hypothetical protein GCM10017667_74770 [Streptomyces filamentosus]